MCGICGFYSRKKETIDNLKQMNNTLSHRGPDDHGEELYELTEGYIAGLAHRRLAIVDLSVLAHQPMHSTQGDISVVFNGEIYNYKELHKALSALYNFKSKSDTEVIIAAYLKWGKEFVHYLNGMFAIALLDRKKDLLLLVRDRIGKKPIYYYYKEGNLCFASELKAIVYYQYFEKKVDTEIVGQFLMKQYIASPNSIYKDTYKLEPGMMLEFQYGKMKKRKYWDIAHIYCNSSRVYDFEKCKFELNIRLRKAIADRLVADVPVGAFLSGGYDSSIVCAIAQELLEKPLKTFCIGFYDDKINEAPYAKKISEYLGTDHTEYYISEQDMLDLIAEIPTYFDEPFADGSQIATMLVSKLAREHVTVALTGDGGDEFFAGYNRYTILQQAQQMEKLGILMHYLRKIPFFETECNRRKIPLKYRIAYEDLNRNRKTQTGISTYLNVIRNILLRNNESIYYEFEDKYQEKQWDIRRMLLDQETYLPDDNLCKVDRASMKYSLECRCPILDKEVMEYSYYIPQEYKDDKGNQKKILKCIAYDYIPKELLERPKQGFGVPIERWLRNSLKNQLEAYIDGDFLRRQNIFHVENTQQFVTHYLKNGDGGKHSGANYSILVWPFFIFQQWYEHYIFYSI